MDLGRELWEFLRVRKKFWLAPILLIMVLLGGVMALAAKAGVLSPFLYPL